ncbi:MAG: DNA/RNA nuclease SfsA [Candidatus Hodarchaeales archaeon]
MHWPRPLISARFIRRENRFLARVLLTESGNEVFAHVPSPGRMRELLIARAPVLLARAANPNRKTAYDLYAVKTPQDILVIVDSRVANKLVKEAFQNKQVFPITELASEKQFGNSRLDFFVSKSSGKGVWIEVKSVTLNEEGTALFPDAPTSRGSRHLEELISAVQQGYEAMAMFIIMRNDCKRFSPNETTDPTFASTLRRAAEQGVSIRAYSLSILEKEFVLGNEVAITL